MDKFVVKTPVVSSTEKKSSHLPVNTTAKERARKYPEGTFHVDDGLLFCSSCNVVIDYLQHLSKTLHTCPSQYALKIVTTEGKSYPVLTNQSVAFLKAVTSE